MYESSTNPCPYSAITKYAMQETFNQSPHPFQSVVISHLLKMMAFSVTPESVLMIRPTGSGKSTIPLTCSIVAGGVTIIIENTLALSSDQTSKIKSLVTSQSKAMKEYQLDIFKVPDQLQQLLNAIILHTENNKNTSIICFLSPETLLHPISIAFIKNLVKKKIADFFTKPLQGRMFNLFQDLVMEYIPLQDILVEIPMKGCVGNNTNVSKNTNENSGALIEITKEQTKEQTLNRVMSAHTHDNNSKRVKWKDKFEKEKQQ